MNWMRHLRATVCWGSVRNRDCILYPGVGTFVLIRPTQTFYERIMNWMRGAHNDPKINKTSVPQIDVDGGSYLYASAYLVMPLRAARLVAQEALLRAR